MVNKVFYFFVLLCSLLSISSCGGGGSSNNNGGGNGFQPTPDVKLGPNVGQALLGPIVGADVEVYAVSNIEGSPICTTESTSLDHELGPGVIDLSECSLNSDDTLYYIKVKGGEDIDVDDDGILDAQPTPKKGDLHALVTGGEINKGSWRINILTELAYQNVLLELAAKEDESYLLDLRDQVAGQLLRVDLDLDGVINGEDLLSFIPATDMSALQNGNTDFLTDIVASIHNGSLNIRELSYRYLLGVVDTLGWVKDFPEFKEGFYFNTFETVQDKQYLYHAGELRSKTLASAPVTLAVRILDIADPYNIELLSDFEVAIEHDDQHVRPTHIVVQDAYAYIVYNTYNDGVVGVEEDGIAIVDFTDSSQPKLIKQLSFGEVFTQDLSIYDNTLYLSTALDGLHVVDISTPANAAKISRINTSAGNVFYKDDYLFVQFSNRVQVYDVSNLAVPIYVDDFVTSLDAGFSVDTFVLDNLLFAGDFKGNIVSIDISDPGNLKEVYSTSIPSGVTRLVSDGENLYVLNMDLLSSFSIDNSGQLQLADSRLSEYFFDINMHGDFIYISSSGSIIVYDRHMLNELVQHLNYYPTPGTAKQLELHNGILFVNDGSHLRAYDIDNPLLAMPELASFPVSEEENAGIAIADDTLYYVAVSDVYIYDIADKHNITQLVRYDLSLDDNLPQGTAEFQMRDVAVYNNYLYSFDIINDGIVIYNVVDKTDPKFEKLFDLNDGESVYYDMKVSDGYLYIVSESGLLDIYDLSDPLNPVRVDNDTVVPGPNLTDTFKEVHIDGDYAYLLPNVTGGLAIFDTRTKDDFMLVHAPVLGSSNGITVNNGVAYIANGFGRLDIFDISNPTAPIFAVQKRINGSVFDIETDGEFVYIANGFGIVIEPTVKTFENLVN